MIVYDAGRKCKDRLVFKFILKRPLHFRPILSSGISHPLRTRSSMDTDYNNELSGTSSTRPHAAGRSNYLAGGSVFVLHQL